MDNPVSILDASGNPMKPKIGAHGYAGYNYKSGMPYDVASNYGPNMETWQPVNWSPDSQINSFRDRIVSRVRDLVRNDGWASGAVTRILDNCVGANFRPISKPDYRMLAQATGMKTFDATWANEFGRAVNSCWRSWANDENHYCDAARQLTMSQIFFLAFRQKLIDNDSLALMLWLPDRLGPGKARYCTTVQLLDSDRLSNPQNVFDMQTMRGGVMIDHLGAATAYYIRRAHQNDWYTAADSVTWDLVPRETPFGRPMVIHDYDLDRPGQHRGGAGIFTPILGRFKMLSQYDDVELQAAIVNAIFGAYVKSPFDPEIVAGALGDSHEMSAYNQARSEFHGNNKLNLNGVRMPHLFPGEDIVPLKSERVNAAYSAFEGQMLRNFASATGQSYEQLSSDWSQSNYSSARGAMLEAWKTMSRRRSDFASGFCQPIFNCFVEESFDIDDLPLPQGAPDFVEYRNAYSACRWIGPGRGWVDPVKERQGALLGIEGGFSTLEQETDEHGTDWEANLEQRKIEFEMFKELGLPLPSWAAPIDQTVSMEKIE